MSDLSPAVKAIIGEAAGEGFEGMRRVAKVIQTRAIQRRLTPDAVVLQPKQFSAMARPDLEAFIARQPPQVVQQAQTAMEQAMREVQPSKLYADHYLTDALYSGPYKPSWADKMDVVERFGGHIFLRERR